MICIVKSDKIGILTLISPKSGYMLPGRPQANIMMKGFGFQMMYQCLFMAQDLKLGNFRSPQNVMYSLPYKRENNLL